MKVDDKYLQRLGVLPYDNTPTGATARQVNHQGDDTEPVTVVEPVDRSVFRFLNWVRSH